MDVNVPDTTPKQFKLINEMQDFWLGGDVGTRQIREGSQHHLALAQVAQSEFANHKRMGENHAGVEQFGERLVMPTQMIDPDGRIHQDHARAGRRRGGASKAGSLPPKRANRRALSRSIRALSASRTRPDFSFNPVKA